MQSMKILERFYSKLHLGSSNQTEKMLLAFISLVEIVELAVSTSFDHDKITSG
jgi:hypothetical protein